VCHLRGVRGLKGAKVQKVYMNHYVIIARFAKKAKFGIIILIRRLKN